MQNHAFEAAIGPASSAVFGQSYTFSFAVQGGFRALDRFTSAALPTELILGPGPPPPPSPIPIILNPPLSNPDWLYVVDTGDTRSNSAFSSTVISLLLGQVIRYDAVTLQLDPNTQVQ